MFTCEPSSCALDIELTLPDRDSTFIDVKENDTVDDVKRQLLSECYGFDASSPYFPAETMVLRFGGDDMANDATMGERGYGLQSGAKLSFEAGDDFNEFWELSELDDDSGLGVFPAIVVDNGSGKIKAGCSGEDAPKVTFSSVVGYRRVGIYSEKDYYIGEEAQEQRRNLRLKYPIEHGVVQDWDNMEKIWRHTFENELRMVVGFEENPFDEDTCGIILTEPPMNPDENRERMTQIMFETFSARRFCPVSGAVLALYASGRTTGVVVNSGSGVTSIVPVYNSNPVSNASVRMDLAGDDLTQYMGKILQECRVDYIQVTRASSKIKEDLCYVSENFSGEVDNFEGKEKQFEMPDGEIITIHNQIIRGPELLFNSTLDGRTTLNLQQCCAQSITRCDSSMQKELLSNIVMAGGNTMFPGMQERLQAEMSKSFDEVKQRVNVIAPPERMISQWIGGSIVAQLSTFSFINKEPAPRDVGPGRDAAGYDEVGPSIVHTHVPLRPESLV